NASTAEAVKIFKGAYRDANIAIANQFAVLADLFNLDILEIIDAANTEPFSHIHKPGIGVGGHCIPVYPKFLITQGKEKGYPPTIFSESRVVNDFMVDYAIQSVKELNDKKQEILIMGIAYRGGVKEIRNSPALRLIPQLREMGIKVKVTDPLYIKEEIDTIFGDGTGIDWNVNLLNKYKLIFITTDHKEFYHLENEFSNHIVYDGRYVIDTDLVEHSKILQPGRLHINN
ncbi:MAG: UDP binding domain-containing protein, partial [Candidatus Kariarchaeaceae archaeon]